MPYILPRMVRIACDVLEILDKAEADIRVTAAYLAVESGYNYYEIAPILSVLRNAGVVTGKTGCKGGYERTKHLTVLELARQFSVRFQAAAGPPVPLTKSGKVQMAILNVLDKIET